MQTTLRREVTWEQNKPLVALHKSSISEADPASEISRQVQEHSAEPNVALKTTPQLEAGLRTDVLAEMQGMPNLSGKMIERYGT